VHIAMITLFPQTPDRIDGGVAGVAKYLADGLVKFKNVKLTVIVPTLSKTGEVVEHWAGYEVRRIGLKPLGSFLPPILYELVFRRREFKKIFEKIKPDLVHFQSRAFWALNCKLPNVVTIHGIAELNSLWEPWPFFARWIKWFLFKVIEGISRRKIKNIILISEYVKNFLPSNKKTQKTWLIENPVDDSYFDVQWDFEPGRIFACGRIGPNKNALGMIKALNLILKDFPAAQLRIAGTTDGGTYLAKCKTYVEKNRLSNSVHFLGSLDTNQIQIELSKANCLLIPSFQETAPLSLEEAMAVGVPVIGSNICGIPYMIEDGKTGFLVNQFDNVSIAEGIRKILADSELAHTMSVRAKQIASERFKASGIAKKTLAVYREILAKAHI